MRGREKPRIGLDENDGRATQDGSKQPEPDPEPTPDPESARTRSDPVSGHPLTNPS